MFDGFDSVEVDVGGTTIFARRKGRGRPLLLLHGFPETHVMWHRVAPVLARQFTVICADLRGYGASGKPTSTADHAPYAKSAMAIDMVRLMETLGFSTFSVAGHDRGARVAYRLALDHPGRVERLALLDVIPTGEAFSRADIRFALAFWPWSLLAQPEPLPERLIAAAPDAVVNDALDNWGSDPASFPPEVRSAYFDALSDPEAIHAICDFARDEADRAANKCICCPTLALWSKESALDHWYEQVGGPLGIWRKWAPDVTGRAIAGGHFFPEQNPSETISELSAFFE
jgi:haloacetate dehalogenase